MPVRDIPIGTRALTGRHARSGARYESGLERDFYELMTQDPLHEVIDWQPVTIHYIGRSGKSLHYTPDALVTFKPDPTTHLRRPPLLAEVKYRDEYRKKFSELKERFQIARIYARQEGWQFKVVTEREIRTASFSNLRFLAGYRDRTPDQAHIDMINAHLNDTPVMSARALLAAISSDLWKQAEIIPMLWWMVAHSILNVDLFKPLSMETPISLSLWR